MFISSRGEGVPSLAKEISVSLGIPHHYLGKVLQHLVRSEFLSSHRGLSGGFALAKPAGSITLQDIVTAVEGPHATNRCLLGLSMCTEERPCPIHWRWSVVRSTALSLLNETTIEELGKECEYVKATDQRLSPGNRHA